MKLNAIVFWVLTALIVGLVCAMAVSTMIHLRTIVNVGPDATSMDTSQIDTLYRAFSNNLPDYERAQLYQALVDAKLNAYSAQQRFGQARLLVATRTWLRYTGMLLGCLLMTIGLIYSMVQLRKYDSTIEADSQIVKLKFVSASPGLILVALGTILIVVAIVSNPPVTIVETTREGEQHQVAQ